MALLRFAEYQNSHKKVVLILRYHNQGYIRSSAFVFSIAHSGSAGIFRQAYTHSLAKFTTSLTRSCAASIHPTSSNVHQCHLTWANPFTRNPRFHTSGASCPSSIMYVTARQKLKSRFYRYKSISSYNSKERTRISASMLPSNVDPMPAPMLTCAGNADSTSQRRIRRSSIFVSVINSQ